MTLTFDDYLDSIKMNQQTQYLFQRSFSSKVTVRTHRQTNTQDQLLYMDH